MNTFKLFYSNVTKIGDKPFDKKSKQKIEAENIQSAINLFIEKYPDDGFPLIGISYGLSGDTQFADNPLYGETKSVFLHELKHAVAEGIQDAWWVSIDGQVEDELISIEKVESIITEKIESEFHIIHVLQADKGFQWPQLTLGLPPNSINSSEVVNEDVTIFKLRDIISQGIKDDWCVRYDREAGLVVKNKVYKKNIKLKDVEAISQKFYIEIIHSSQSDLGYKWFNLVKPSKPSLNTDSRAKAPPEFTKPKQLEKPQSDEAYLLGLLNKSTGVSKEEFKKSQDPVQKVPIRMASEAEVKEVAPPVVQEPNDMSELEREEEIVHQVEKKFEQGVDIDETQPSENELGGNWGYWVGGMVTLLPWYVFMQSAGLGAIAGGGGAVVCFFIGSLIGKSITKS